MEKEMTIRTYKRSRVKGTSWSYAIDAGKDATGKRQRITAHGFNTKREANDAAQVRLNELKEDRAREAQAAPETLSELMTRWYAQNAERRCSPKTIERYKELVSYVAPAVLNTMLGDLTAMMLEAEMIRLHESGGKKRSKGLSAKTVRNTFSVIAAALGRAVGWGLLKHNPADGVQLPAAEAKEAKALAPDQTQRLLDFARGHWSYPILEFAAATGCRRGEILALTWSEVNMDGRFAVISKSLEQTKAGLRLKMPKSNRVRVCPLPVSVIETLKEHRRQQEDIRRQFGHGYRTDLDLVFAAADGDYLKPDSVTATVCLYAKKAGFEHVGLHSLRHSHGSHLLAAGVSIPTVSKRLGHANPAITMKIYAHSFTEDEAKAAETWDAVMKAPREASKSIQ